jgi:hypothetical protein
MNPEILAKIESRWPHLATMCATVRATGNPQVRNAIISAVLLADVAYLTPREVMHLAALRASATTSRAKRKASRENGKLGGRPKKDKEPGR